MVAAAMTRTGIEQGGGAKHRNQSPGGALVSPGVPTARNIYRGCCRFPLRPLPVKMRLERPAGRDKRQYKNNISFKYAQSEAEGILNGQITWNKKNFR